MKEVMFGTLLLITFFSTITKGTLLPTASLNLQEVNLVRCLTYISQRYFAPGRPLVISSPATYRNVQQGLIAEFHHTSLWPVVVTVDGNISKPKRTDFIAKDGSFIILIQDGNIESFKSRFTGLERDRTKWTRLWNSEARFVVAGASEFSMSQQTDIFHYLSELRIYNCIIVSRKHYTIDQEHNRKLSFNVVDSGMQLVVYTWFPYQSSDRCIEVNDITLLDSWVISAQGHFTKNTDLFPIKIRKSFNGCPMKAIIRDCAWNILTNYVKYTHSNGSVVTYIEGLEFDLLKLVLKQMNMTFFHVPTPFDFSCFDKDAGTFGLIRALTAKEAYIVLGGVAPHISSDPILDSTNSYYIFRLRWYVPCSFKNPRWSSIFRVLSVELWLVLIISVLIAAISTTIVGRYSCSSEWQGYRTLSSSLTNVWAVILGVSVPTMPRATALRLLFLAWVCFSLAFSTVFQAFLTTFLIESGYKTPIRNVEEMFASGIKFVYPPSYHSFFKNGDETGLNVLRNRVNCPTFRSCFQMAFRHKNASVLFSDIDAQGKYASGDMLDENSEPSMCGLQDGVVANDGISLLMLQGDPLIKRVTEIIDRVVEANLYNYWVSREIYSLKLRSRKKARGDPLDEYYSFNLYHMQPAFYFLSIGWGLSVLCLIVELLYNRVFS